MVWIVGLFTFCEYILLYQGVGASMWPIAQLFGGTIAAIIGIAAYYLCRYLTVARKR